MFQQQSPSGKPDPAHRQATIPFPTIRQPETVPVAAGDVLALMMHAARTNRAWIQDFADEVLYVSKDMYELLVAYREIAMETNRRAA